jgi:protein AbiQ
MSDQDIVFHQLTAEFYKDHHHLKERLDKWEDKGRGYGVLLVAVAGHTFAIPLRSKMDVNHPANFYTKIHSPEGKQVKHGLDYTKAVIITDSERYISKAEFKLADKNDYVKIIEAQHRIIKAFEKYVKKYIDAVKKQDSNILQSRKYRYSTLQNYHEELGCLEHQDTQV